MIPVQVVVTLLYHDENDLFDCCFILVLPSLISPLSVFLIH